MLSKLLYTYVKKKKDALKRHADIRGEMLWLGPKPAVLSESDLIVGDVLFCGSANSDKATRLIQNLTDGSYVHCGVYIGNSVVAEVTLSGAREVVFKDFYKNYTYLAAARCPGIDNKRAADIQKYALQCVKNSVKYNWWGALLLPISEYYYIKSQYRQKHEKYYKKPRLSKKYFLKKRMFCSEFIVRCFIACNYIANDDPYCIPHKSSPTWLAEQNTFELLGYIAPNGLLGVDDNDPFLGGCSRILGK